MRTFTRLFRHLFTTSAAGRRAFPPATLKAVAEAIAGGEKRHRAELRLIVEASMPAQAVLAGISPRERARELFAHYRIWDTEENCGVLVYVNLADRQVEIVADRGVGRTIKAGEWQDICRRMTRGFAENNFHDSTLTALEQLNALLQAHYPDDGSVQNQLPNEPVVL
jgi:uncharacterized membrane protein